MKIENMKLYSANIKNSEIEQKLIMDGFKRNCDIFLDTILGTLFVLCYLAYKSEGNIFENIVKL